MFDGVLTANDAPNEKSTNEEKSKALAFVPSVGVHEQTTATGGK